MRITAFAPSQNSETAFSQGASAMNRHLATLAFVASAVALVLLSGSGATATSIVPLTFDELITRATVIFRGEVVDVRSEWRDSRDGRAIVSLVTFNVESSMKGA